MQSVKPDIREKTGLRRRPKPKGLKSRRFKPQNLVPFFTLRSFLWLALIVTLLVGALSGIFPTFQQLKSWPQEVKSHITSWINRQAVNAGFVISTISVSPLEHLSRNDIVKQLALSPEQSSLFFNVHEARKRLEKLGWVRKASVQLFYPRSLYIKITEEQPFSVWKDKSRFWLIEQEGQKIAPVDIATASAYLPVLVGQGANREAASFLATLKSFPKLWQQSVSAVYIEDRRWDLSLRSGIILALPENGIRAALKRYGELSRKHDLTHLEGRKISTVDLRLKDRIGFY